jgi:predicted nucleotidyltransferase
MQRDLGNRIKKATFVLKEFGAREVYVFGSSATNSFESGADVDLAVSGLPPKVFFQAMGKAADALGCELDLVDLDDDNLFTRYLMKKGKLHRVG